MAEINTQPPFSANPGDPTLADVLALTKKELLLALCAHHIGTITKVDFDKLTADATINYKKTFYRRATSGQYVPELVDYPQLVDCPLFILSGGDAAFTAPIAVGDECLIAFNDRDMDNWFQGNSGAGPNTPRLHSFSDAMILVGVRSLNNILANYDQVRACIRSKTGETAVGVNPSNHKILLTNSAPANTTTLRTILQTMVGHLQSLASACASITVSTLVSGSPVISSAPINASTFSSLATSLASDATAIAGLLE